MHGYIRRKNLVTKNRLNLGPKRQIVMVMYYM